MAEVAFDRPTEIVIVRRRTGEDAMAGKGGAWKIAYADFVTAMMAFFLVMWLINASNEATRAQVASYFNPIKLMDSSTGSRGVVDAKTAAKAGRKQQGEDRPVSREAEAAAEEKLLEEPQRQLDRIADKPLTQSVVILQEPGSAESSPQDAGAAKALGAGDPFDPQTWNKIPPAANGPTRATQPEAQPDRQQQSEAKPKPAENLLKDTSEELVVSVPVQASGHASPVSDVGAASAGSPTQETAESESTSSSRTESGKADDLEMEILMTLGRKPDELTASLEVHAIREGMLISLVDRHLFGMFKSGSAEPEPQLIELVGAIAKVLGRHPGNIVIRGHTDATPYRNKKYDNWQLSTARAHMAQYMLVRGGLDELRIHRVEGLADREPRIQNSPNAPENRRIDILLEAGP